MSQVSLQSQAINTIKFLSVDGVQTANSGHPGLPMGTSGIAYTLWMKLLRYNPKNPKWFNRDRFILSGGHGSMLIYSLLHLTGFDVSLEDLKSFRQWKSITPGHPEYGMTPGVEVTTGPLGQGFANGVGMAIAESHLAAEFNRPGHEIIDHTYHKCLGKRQYTQFLKIFLSKQVAHGNGLTVCCASGLQCDRKETGRYSEKEQHPVVSPQPVGKDGPFGKAYHEKLGKHRGGPQPKHPPPRHAGRQYYMKINEVRHDKYRQGNTVQGFCQNQNRQ